MPDKMYAVIETSQGNMTLILYPKLAPKTVENFIALAKKPFYDGTIFHRVIPNFMIQGGDPTGTGMGGPGYKFEDEFTDELGFDRPGRLAMANSGPNSNGSQFFISVAPTPWLDGHHTIFGQVIEGQDIADKISMVKRGQNDKPIDPVVLKTITIKTEL